MWNHQHKLLPVTSGQHSLSIAQLYLYLYTFNGNSGQPSESINVKTENPTEYAAPACTITSSSTPIIQWYWPLGTGTPLSPGLPRPIIIQVVSMPAWPTHHPASQPLLSRTIVAKVAVTRPVQVVRRGYFPPKSSLLDHNLAYIFWALHFHQDFWGQELNIVRKSTINLKLSSMNV